MKCRPTLEECKKIIKNSDASDGQNWICPLRREHRGTVKDCIRECEFGKSVIKCRDLAEHIVKLVRIKEILK